MDKKWINIAVVGCGRIYNDAHRDAYINKTSTNLALIGLCDKFENLLKDQFKWIKKKLESKLKKAKKKDRVEEAERIKFSLDNLKTYTDYDKMLDDLEGKLDLVDNCTHGAGHIPLSIQAMEHGYHAMAEKPPGMNWMDVKRAVEAEKKTGKFFQLNENVCYEKPTQRCREVILEGYLGKIDEINIAFGHGGPYVPYTIGKTGLPHFIDPVLSGGGCLQDLAPHGISKAFWPVGPGGRVVSCNTKVLERRKNPRVMSGKDFESPVDDWAEAVLELHDPRTNSNYTMNVTTSWCGSPAAFTPFDIHGEKGTLTIVQNPASKAFEPVLYPEDEVDDTFFGLVEDDWEKFKGHTREIQIFCDNLLKGKPSHTPASYALALEETLSIQYFSKLQGKEVTLEEMDAWGEDMLSKYDNKQEGIEQISVALIKAVDLL
ncbi:MAG: Gfo/Idh/MocA family protein [Promethearchaeota archaeon]